VNQKEIDAKAFSHLTSYVQQDDAMFAALTVRETLMTAAHFQLPSSLSQAEKDEYVDSIINELGLNKCKDTKIGDAKERGVSGGEVRLGEERRDKRRLERSDRKSNIPPSYITNNLPLVASLIAAQEGEHWR